MVFDGYCIIFLIYGAILSCWTIFYPKSIMSFCLQNHWYISIPNTWFLVAHQRKTKENTTQNHKIVDFEEKHALQDKKVEYFFIKCDAIQ